MANEEHLAKLKEGVEAWNRWREENPTVHPNLGGADLSGADLNGANLARAYLGMARLIGAILIQADLSRANLKNADLTRAKLIGANLNDADLTSTNLNDADLTSANLSYAALFVTNLTDAYLHVGRLGYTTLADVDLSETKGLEDVHHSGPSTIGTNTLTKSKGRAPEVFLRGCGLQDWEIKAAKLYSPDLSEGEITTISYEIANAREKGKAFDFFSAFISYSHADKAFARRLHDGLQKEGIRCWLDEHQMLPGDDIYEQVDRGIKHWDKVLLCCSEASLTSWWVDNEIDSAFEKERQLMKERGKKVLALIPLDLDGYLFSGQWQSGKERQVKSRLAGDFKDWEEDDDKFQRGFEQLLKSLRTGDTGREPPPKSKL